ncbi:TetR/AcrR family transcriptional regulator [Amycolatopsis eburnea]|uniref:TetR/AcrR family transcriptional regulator n=1 Tax=Amycolatopsis eburnea TaxID=2267691 RepID=A0A3R9KS83_9PSEU|nr:TetR/AcrR family transcriptional regulator [Amycolatopsis eburnea]RSD24927.1 TetR/AcrR family transcriptional regulator [Amycolatopsis eburnea]
MARPRSFDEAAVLRTARDQFWETGYAGTKVDDLAAATGLGKGSLYGAFGDKHALYLRVFDHHCAEMAESTRRQLDGPDDTAYARLSGHVHAIAESVAADQARRGCLIAKSTAECAEHDEAVAARSRRLFEDIQDHLTTCIAGAQRAGDLAGDQDPARLAGLVLAVLRGLEALGKGGVAPAGIRAIAETALAVLPKPVKD